MMNPVLRREAITTMRSWKTYGALVVFLAVSAVGACLYINLAMYQNYDMSFDRGAMVWLYVVVAAVEMGLVMLGVPAIAAGSISGERERQTLDLLLVTKMRPISIILGKWMASLLYLLLLIFATLPVFAIAFYFGNVSIGNLALLLVFVLCTACMVGAVSVFFSCIFKRTIVSIVLMYLVIGLLCFGTLVLLAFLYLGVDSSGNRPFPYLQEVLVLIPNPGVAFFSLMDMQMGTNVDNEMLRYRSNMPEGYVWMVSHLWLLHLVFDVVITIIFTALSAYVINPVREKKKG